MYMSYCRFEGTDAELRACLNDVDKHVNGEAEYAVSDSEIHHFRRMVDNFAAWICDMNLLDEDGCLDEDVLDEICEAMKKGG